VGTEGLGGGLFGCYGTIRNCIIWGNTAPTGTQLFLTATPTFSCIEDWSGDGIGNISHDPRLVDPASGNFGLLPISPCIDAGGTVSLTYDYEGDRRPFEYTLVPRGDGSYFDIGADEALPAPNLGGQFDGIEPGEIVWGQDITFYGWVFNDSNLGTSETVVVEFWAKRRASGFAALLFDRIEIAGGLGAGRSVNVHAFSPRPCDDGIPSGVYDIEMWIDPGDAVDELNEGDNVLTGYSVVVLPERPDLEIEGFDFAPQDTDPAGGTAITFTGNLVNSGSRATTDTIWVEFMVWPTLPIQPRQMFLCDSIPLIGGLPAGESIALPDAPLRTNALPPGAYYVGVMVDPTDMIAEQDETDNFAYLLRKRLYVGPRPTAAAAWLGYR
jgi:hypothetical protein